MPPKKRPPRMGPPEKFTPAQIIAALEASAGIRAGAARILKCARTTITNYVDKYQAVREALAEILETRCDVAEGTLLKRMADDSNPSAQVQCCVFYLKTMGRHRGYGEPPRQRMISIALPRLETTADVLDANRLIIERCAAGEIAPSEAKGLADLLDLRLRALAHVEHEARFDAIEQHLKQLGLSSARH